MRSRSERRSKLQQRDETDAGRHCREEVQVPDLIGSLGWNRTNDQRINSPTLYR